MTAGTRPERPGLPELADPPGHPARRARHALLTVAAGREADRRAVAAGIPIARLMAAAGSRVAEAALAGWPRHRVEVLCGPGDNGGDGYVAALRLRLAGRPTRVRAMAPPRSAAARAAAGRWRMAGGDCAPLTAAGLAASPPEGVLVIDALFGAGLSRPLAGEAAAVAAWADRARVAVLAIDMPSGVHGDSGHAAGAAFRAAATVAFERPRPGHFLAAGPERSGRLLVRPIGIPAAILAAATDRQRIWQNHPGAWRLAPGRAAGAAHKYHHGHVLVWSGPPAAGGAARLAARGALGVGAGLVTVVAEPAALAEHAARLDAIMLRPRRTLDDWVAALGERGASAAVLGPGAGPGMREAVLASLAGPALPLVLDADALTAFAAEPETLFARLPGRPVLLTPHGGEFARLFPDLAAELAAGGRTPLAVVRDAARRCGAAVLLKGRSTLVALPDGTAWVNAATGRRAVPWLATAGAGDVLAGMAAGLLARGADPESAALAAAWMHVEAARMHGPGLTADDLPGRLPAALRTVARLQAGS